MTSQQQRDEPVREIFRNASYIPFRGSPKLTPAAGIPSASTITSTRNIASRSTDTDPAETSSSTDLQAGQKRNSPENVDKQFDSNSPLSKKARCADYPSFPASVFLGHEEPVRGRRSSVPGSPTNSGTGSATPRLRSTSPGTLTSILAAETMLNRAEELGGNRVTKLTRGLPSSPVPSRSTPWPSNRQISDATSNTRNVARKDSTGSQILDVVGLGEFLQHDERPIFVLDLEAADPEELPIIFINTTLRLRPGLVDSIYGRFHEEALVADVASPWEEFRKWLLNEPGGKPSTSPFQFGGPLWKSTTLRGRLRIVTGTDFFSPPSSSASQRFPPRPQRSHLGSSSSSHHTLRRNDNQVPGYFDIPPASGTRIPATMENLVSSTSEPDADSSFDAFSNGPPTTTSQGDSAMHDLLRGPSSVQEELVSSNHLFPLKSDPESLQPMSMDYLTDKGFFDWTRLPTSPSLPPHIQFAKSFDWAKTSLGPIEEWPADLRAMCNLIMASPHPAAMYWGPEHVAIYNEPYVMLAGNKHPELMGSRYRDAWKEIWHLITEVFEVAMSSAQATMKDDDCLFIMRNGFLEETYFSWSIIPLIGDDGSVVGLYNPCFEKTRRKIAERRMLTLREIGERTAAARAVSDFWALLLQGFEVNEYDAPMVIIYSLNESEDSDVASSASSTAAASKQCRLEGTLGVEKGHPCAPEIIDLRHDTSGFGAVFKRAINAERPIVLTVEHGTLDESLLQGIEWRGFGDPSRIVVVAPIRPTTGESTLGFIVMATNPRRPYDEDYDLFVQLLSRQLATSIASVVLFEEEIRKGERAAQLAAQDRIDLTNQLAVRTQEAVQSENKFTRMAELAPVGMFIGDNTGKITFANDAWYRLSSFPLGKYVGNDWIDYLKNEDKATVWALWQKLLKKKCAISIEFRFKTPWRDQSGNKHDTWVLGSASPELDDAGDISRVFGSITDISSQKFVESLQRKRMEEAITLKQQQERYIDTTSHEMRNPLSAILQSADAITSSLQDMKISADLPQPQVQGIDSIIESAQTITLCAQHQKRIVDDVLTLSKLDSAMLLVTPIDTQPEAVARRTVKMFEGECQTADVQLHVQVDKSYRSLSIDYVRLDPTRLSQVLINLMTNAIKFTTTQEKRIVKMHLAASREKPSQEANYNLTYIPSQAPKDKDVTASPAWGLGEPLYIHFAVSDTGRGLDEEEKKQLFRRFSQANPRTHVTYGGSGLGLFISRELVELQGGEIGVASEPNKGSTFAFYVKARRSQAPLSGSDEDVMDMHLIASRKSSAASVNSRSRNSKSKGQPGEAEHPLATVDPQSIGALAKPKHSAAGTRVLIVEDNLINQKVLATQLKKIGCIVSVANHGGEAIDHIKQTTFYKDVDQTTPPKAIDIVLMDLEMPVMDGITCARTLRAMQKDGQLTRHIPVIAVTANAREEQIKNTLEAGIDDVVSKPFRIPELVPKMKATIARFAVQDGDFSKATLTDSSRRNSAMHEGDMSPLGTPR